MTDKPTDAMIEAVAQAIAKADGWTDPTEWVGTAKGRIWHDYRKHARAAITAMTTASDQPVLDTCPSCRRSWVRDAARAPITSDADGEWARQDVVAGSVWHDDDGDCWKAEIQIIGGHEQIAEIYADSEQSAAARQRIVLAALSANNSIGGLVGALKEHDAAVAKCPVQKRFHDICPRCKATSSEGCGVVDRADYAFVEAVRALLLERGEPK